MPRFKDPLIQQGRFVSIQFQHQILPGTFEHALNYIVDHVLDLSVFLPHYHNDAKGAAAFDPHVMLKIILFAYSKGILSSRDIEAACRQNVVFMALSGDTQPHFTTIAGFIAEMADVIKPLFGDVLLYCDELGLIGKEMFAIDGCKISSNASKEWSGTKEDFERKKQKFQESIGFLLKKHKAEDTEEESSSGPGKSGPRRHQEEKAIDHLKAKVAKIGQWLASHEDRIGADGKPKKSNLTDPDSAKMVTSHGVLQGYNGVAAVDAKRQIIVTAEAFGEGSEVGVLEPMVDKIKETFQQMGEPDIYQKALVTADSGYHSEKNMKMLSEKGVDAFVADKMLRKRDPRFDTANRHRQPVAAWRERPPRKYFGPDDFPLNPATGKLTCPAGHELYVKDRNFKTHNGFKGIAYKAKITDCRGCDLRAQCLRVPTTPARQVYKFYAREIPEEKESFTQKMIKKMDSLTGRFLYSRRMGTVEPVFGNIRHMLGLDRFTLRGKTKVNVQWNLFAMVHNVFKIQRYGWLGGTPAGLCPSG